MKRVVSVAALTCGLTICIGLTAVMDTGLPSSGRVPSSGHLSREERRRMIEAVVIGIANYNDVYKRLPGAIHRDAMGRPLSSWRFLILPFVAAGWPKHDLSVPWYDPANWAVASRRPVFYCFERRRSGGRSFDTNVLAVTGPGTAFDEHQAYSLGQLDGDTALVLEVCETGLHWMEPGDIEVVDLRQSFTSGLDGAGVHVGFADGEVWFLSARVPVDKLKEFFLVQRAKAIDRGKVLEEYRLP
ncbi:MAG TPA: DUF1559 domain-containing protein [Planctomycetes bacterium]|nr:DUF1559 domain-containing protein [Planctomycetota bacterium]